MNRVGRAVGVVIGVAALALAGCGDSSQPTCDECLAQQDQTMDPDGCWPYCEEQPDDPPVEWSVTASATPVILARSPDASQPRPISAALLIQTSGAYVTGLCTTPIPIGGGRFRSSAGVTCWTNATLPSFLASDSPDTWTACDGAVVTMYSLDLYFRNMDTVVYMEGSASIEGCGRSWTTVLFQVDGVRHQ